jgi:hypothetical protein
MVTHGPSGVSSRPGVRLGKEVERFRRSKIAAHNANAYKRRVAAKEACGGTQPVTRPRGPHAKLSSSTVTPRGVPELPHMN